MEIYKKKNIAIFSSFNYHYEMFGYIIEFSYKNNYNLVIFTDITNDQGWLDYYKTLFLDFIFEIKNFCFFQQEKYLFDIIFLTCDTDKLYFHYFDSNYLKNNTICITHSIKYLYTVTAPDTYKTIYVRPLETTINSNWFLPCYSIDNSKNRIELNKSLLENDYINIALIGTCIEYDVNSHLVYYNYNVQIINRLSYKQKIKLHVIARYVTSLQLYGLNPSIELHTYENIQTTHMFDILKKCQFIMTDVNCHYKTTYEIYRFSNLNEYTNRKHIGNPSSEEYYYKYEKRVMSGAIPLAFSLCVPLIISKQTNEYYKFKNVIEFDKNSDDTIILTDISPELIENERNEMINKFNYFINNSIEKIISNKIYKMEHKRNYKICYINIDDRTDRQIRFEKHMNDYNLFFERYSAIKHDFGPIGCAKSHLNVLKNAKENNYENIIIMEDDFAFNIPPKVLDEKLKLIFDNNLDFDVFHLSFRWRLCEDISEYSYLKKLTFCHYCSCYIVNNKCYDEIIDCWEKALILLKTTKKSSLYSCDISYTHLLRKKKWYCFNEPLGMQLSGYSNIENRYINHYEEDILEHPCPDRDPTTLYFNSLD